MSLISDPACCGHKILALQIGGLGVGSPPERIRDYLYPDMNQGGSLYGLISFTDSYNKPGHANGDAVAKFIKENDLGETTQTIAPGIHGYDISMWVWRVNKEGLLKWLAAERIRRMPPPPTIAPPVSKPVETAAGQTKTKKPAARANDVLVADGTGSQDWTQLPTQVLNRTEAVFHIEMNREYNRERGQ